LKSPSSRFCLGNETALSGFPFRSDLTLVRLYQRPGGNAIENVGNPVKIVSFDGLWKYRPGMEKFDFSPERFRIGFAIHSFFILMKSVPCPSKKQETIRSFPLRFWDNMNRLDSENRFRFVRSGIVGSLNRRVAPRARCRGVPRIREKGFGDTGTRQAGENPRERVSAPGRVVRSGPRERLWHRARGLRCGSSRELRR